MEPDIRELLTMIENLNFAVANLTERVEDIKPLATFIRENEERDAADEELKEDDIPD